MAIHKLERPLNGEALRKKMEEKKKKDREKRIKSMTDKTKARKKNRSKKIGKGMKLFPKKPTRKK